MENTLKILESGSAEEKIKILETLDNIDDPEILEKMISKLNDDSVAVRGEAFSSLILNKNKIVNFLINNLKDADKNVRGFTSLVLANRNEISAIPEIIKLVKDERSMVRSCAFGALGHLKAHEAKETFLEGISDSNLEVKKSALQAIIDLEIPVSKENRDMILRDSDSEIEKMISLIKK